VKVFFDHNMSPAMARAFRELFKNEHEICTLAELLKIGFTERERSRRPRREASIGQGYPNNPA
jgi:hypothetical protein